VTPSHAVGNMRILSLVLLALTTSVCLAPLTAAEPPTSDLSRVVGSVYGKTVTAADIGLTAPIDTSLKFDARDTEQWKLMERITTAFGKPISDRFVKEHEINVTGAEIAAFKKISHEQRQEHLRETENQLAKVETELARPNLPSDAKIKLEEQQAMLDRLLPMMREAAVADVPDELARMFIVARKIERELQRTYGGRVIFQQAGPEALDARRQLYEEAEKNGNLKFDDAGVRHLFYYYSNMSHSLVDEKMVDKLWSSDGRHPADRISTGLQSPRKVTEQTRQALVDRVVRLEQRLVQLNQRVAALEQNRVARMPSPATVKTQPKAAQAVKTWVVLESSAEPSAFAPQRIVPVESGVWFGGRQPGSGSGPIGFLDFDEGGVILLIANGSANWDAVGREALAVQLDRQSFVRLSAAERSAATWEKRPEGCSYFNQVVAFRHHFCISSPYNPLWVFDPWLQTWQKIELEPVTDSDSERLGANYYRPSLSRFVIGPSGDVWGFQGTLDAGRGNAVCCYNPGRAKWEQYGFPWETARGDDHWPIGATDTVVMFAGPRDLLLFDKESHRWTTAPPVWAEGSYGSAKFTRHGVLIPVGDTVKQLAPDLTTWDNVATLGNGQRITAIAVSGNSLYLATASGIHVLDKIDADHFGKPRSYPWKFADQAKIYRAVFGLASQDRVLALADKLCKASTEGNLELVRRLLSEGADTEATTDPTGSTPLMLACSGGYFQVAELLIENGADVNARNMTRQNALTMAARGGHRELADYLMSKGAKR